MKINTKINKWTTLSEVYKKGKKRYIRCSCKCGLIKEVNYYNLIKGKSAGCFNCRDTYKKHGKTNHRLYSTWKSMRSRCNNGNTKSYKNYGGRGIKVCDRWNDFENFLQDMEGTFREGLTLDRINNDGDYTPSNCKWSTKLGQVNNQRKSLKLEYKGKFYTESQLSKFTGVRRTTIQARRNRGATVYEMVHGFNKK